MLNVYDILETIRMIQDECLDIRTITMGISLLDCIDTDIDKACEKVYNKIVDKAHNLVPVGQQIEKEYGIPIINKRISVTPIAMLAAACPNQNPVKFAKALQRAADTCGVNFIGGYSALVHKGFSAGDMALIQSGTLSIAFQTGYYSEYMFICKHRFYKIRYKYGRCKTYGSDCKTIS